MGVETAPVEVVYRTDPAALRDVHPSSIVRLGEIGTLRDQTYVAVHVAPIRYDPELPGLRTITDVEVTVVFDGDDGTRSPTGPDPWFEDVYRGAFVNYEQGTRFRLDRARTEAATAVPDVRSAGVDASGPIRRIRVRATGPVRLDAARLSGTEFLAEPISTWKLSSRGVEVPMLVHDVDADDVLDAGDWVQFYGQRLDEDPKAVLNTDLPGDIDLYEARDFSDEAAYFLTVEPGARSRLAERDAAPTYTRSPPTSFEATTHVEVDDSWRPLGGADPWYWSPTLRLSGTTSRTEDVPLPGLASGTASVRVRALLRGVSEDLGVTPDHRTRVTLLNSSSQVLQQNDDDGTFDGRMLYLHDFTWAGGGAPTLTDPAKVRVETRSVASSTNDVIRDWIEILYPRTFAAQGDLLEFTWPDGDAEFVVTAMNDPVPEVWEITGVVGSSAVRSPVRLTNVDVTGTGPYAVRFRVDADPAIPDGAPRRFVVAGGGSVLIPASADFQADTMSDLRNTSNQADLIVIAHEDLLDDPTGCTDTQVQAYLDHRLVQDGMTSRLVCLRDVVDEFNDGLAGPTAIRNFLRFVLSTEPGEGWLGGRPTSFVLLLGDGSYDYKGGTAAGSYVPTQILFKDDPSIGYYASDNILAAVVGNDPLSDLMIGRLSVRTPLLVDRVLQKILDYEQLSPPGPWKAHAVLIADRGKGYDAFEASEFERINTIGENKMQRPPYSSRRLDYWSDPAYCGETVPCPLAGRNAMRQDIKNAVRGIAQPDGSDGAAVVQFNGHGNFELWSDDIVFCGVGGTANCPVSDTDDLDNGPRLPWLLVNNCLTGGFHTPAAGSFGENWITQDGGGAAAVLAPSGLGFRFLGERVTETIWEAVFGGRKERRLGTPVMDNLVDLCGPGGTSVEGCQYYVLLGDPSMRLQIPAPDPAQCLESAAGNAVVDLTWTSGGSTSYRVYRSRLAGSGYQQIADAVPCAGSTCAYADTSAINATDYYYYVVALDPDGFESRWSNFNDPCSGDTGACPQCVRARPVNPNAPDPPVGVQVVDAQTGGRLDVSWIANVESDLLEYTVHYGKQPGNYTDSRSAGKGTTIVLTGLDDGPLNRYYVAVTATNTSGNTSDFSAEVSEYPTLVLGLEPPGFVSDLHVDKSGVDAALSWGAVTTDIYGRPKAVAEYEVYRGTTANFVPDLSNRIWTGTATSLLDVGALDPVAPDYHYLVRAVGTDGVGGGLGRQLPAGVTGLEIGRAGQCAVTISQECRFDAECPGGESCTLSGSDLVLSWPAIATDFDGGPSVVDRYEVHAASAPFGRADVFAGTVPTIVTTTETRVRITPAAGARYYSVIVIDGRGNESPY